MATSLREIWETAARQGGDEARGPTDRRRRGTMEDVGEVRYKERTRGLELTVDVDLFGLRQKVSANDEQGFPSSRVSLMKDSEALARLLRLGCQYSTRVL